MTARAQLAKTPLATAGLEAFFGTAGYGEAPITYPEATVIYAQGDPSTHVYYVQRGSVMLTVLSDSGKEAVVAILWPGDFFGERCLTGKLERTATASALSTSTIVAIPKAQFLRLIHTERALSDQFLACLLRRNIQSEEGLVDQLLDSSEKRVARCLMRLAHQPLGAVPLDVPHVSQETLAEMVGTTRSRVNFFLNKFRALGFIDYDGFAGGHRITLNPALWTVLLRPQASGSGPPAAG